MKSQKQIKKKIKEVSAQRLELSDGTGGVFIYLLGFFRALEWVLKNDKD